MSSPLVLPPGEPVLLQAILKASKARGAGYVHRYAGVEGWYVGTSIPFGVDVYYRIIAQRIYVRTKDGTEAYFGKIVGSEIIQEGTPDDLKPAGR